MCRPLYEIMVGQGGHKIKKEDARLERQGIVSEANQGLQRLSEEGLSRRVII